MKIISFETKDYELADFARAKEYGLEATLNTQPLTRENLSAADGYEGVTTLGFSDLRAPVIEELARRGVKYLATRTVGFNHIDLGAAKQCGIRVSSAFYEPYNVADFTVMLMLMLLRKAKISVCRALVNDFSLDGMCGREMRHLTVGILGAGRIGRAVIRNLSGFGCTILYYDPCVPEGGIPGAQAADPDTIYRTCDILSLHMPLTGENRHMINADVFAKMKPGALLINTARGGLVDTQALTEALESGRLGGAGLDTIESEEGAVHIDLRARIVAKRDLFYLKQFPNVIFTSHYAFFTEEAASAMVQCALKSLSLFERGEKNPYEIG